LHKKGRVKNYAICNTLNDLKMISKRKKEREKEREKGRKRDLIIGFIHFPVLV